jgi:hypothetical protein
MIQIARYYWRSRFTGQLGRGEDVSRRGGRDGEQAARGGGVVYSLPLTPDKSQNFSYFSKACILSGPPCGIKLLSISKF